MNRTTSTLFVFAILGVLLGIQRGYWSLRAWMLPALTSEVLTESGMSVESQRAAWFAYNRALQCEAVQPCLRKLTPANWERNPYAIERACASAHARIEALPLPAELPPAVLTNIAFLRTYWLRETSSYVTQAGGADTEGGTWTALLTFELDTTTSSSIPTQIDQLYGLVAVGAHPPPCDPWL